MTNQLYQRLLKQTPDEPAANYLYGSYLAGHDELRAKSIPYLKKALQVRREESSTLTLGIVYMSLGEKQKALDCLAAILHRISRMDPRGGMIIQALKNKRCGATRRVFEARGYLAHAT